MILADSYCEFGIKEHCKNILQDTHITQHNALDLYKIGHINEIDVRIYFSIYNFYKYL